MNKFLTALGDWWYVFRVHTGENIITLGVTIMPRGPEQTTMDQNLYNYVIWSETDAK